MAASNFDPYKIFSPSAAIGFETSQLFIGREPLIAGALSSLERPGGSIVIFGERGVGKTSYARIVLHALQGDMSSFRPKAREGKKKYKGIWCEVDGGVRTTEGLFYRLLNPNLKRASSFAGVFPKVASEIKHKYDRLDPTLVLAKRTKKGDANEHQLAVHGIFEEAEQLIESLYGDICPVIFVDEMDQLDDKKGLGKIIKSRSISFALIGISDNFEELVDDHPSVTRKISGQFLVPRLNEDEVRSLFSNATSVAKGQGADIRFQSDFLAAIVEDSGGLAGRCHLIGAQILKRHEKDVLAGPFNIDLRVYREALSVVDSTARYAIDVQAKKLIDASLAEGTNSWPVMRELATFQPEWVTIEKLEGKDLPAGVLRQLKSLLKRLEKEKILDLKDKKCRFSGPEIWSEVKRRVRIGLDP